MKEPVSHRQIAENPSPLEAVFYDHRKQGRKALVAYLCGGFPSLSFSEELAYAVIEAGADVVEIGNPFSDPLADGPVIQDASQQALRAGANTRRVVEMAGSLKAKTGTPIVIMSYFNPILKYGTERFCLEGAGVGIDGVVVPDLPVEESPVLAVHARKYGLACVPLAAPTTTGDRMQKIAAAAEGFIYCVSSTGTTGGRLDRFDAAENLGASLREITSKPLVLGFGIADPQQISRVPSCYDGVIVGSSLVRLIDQYGGDPELCLVKVRQYVGGLKEACVSTSPA